jgi:type IV secretory pathway TraG/TraD family ATPase VirD4
MYAHQTTVREDGAKISQGLSEIAIPLMTAWEIMRMRDEDILVFHRSLMPIRAKRMDWRREPALSQRRQMSPPALQILRLKEKEPQTIWHRKEKRSSFLDPIDPSWKRPGRY